ncbi:MAG: hypothetical protein QGG14_03545 [Planctomycetota bacterium]|nr:hypothetical protein [Planctomycetota bacterium]
MRDQVTGQDRKATPLVVIHERTLREPLEDAVRRARASSPGSQILVVGPDEPEELAGPVLTPCEATDRSHATLPAPTKASIEEAAVQRVGQAWLQSEQMMTQWAEEAKSLANSLERALGSSHFDELNDGVRRLIELTDWMQTSCAEALHRAGKAARGMELHNTALFVRDAAHEIHSKHPGVDLTLPPLEDAPLVMCAPAAVCAAFSAALEAVSSRIAGQGQIRVEIEEGALSVLHRFRGTAFGPDLGDVPGHVAGQLYQLVVEVHGGRILPGRDGSPAELVIALPTAYGDQR